MVSTSRFSNILFLSFFSFFYSIFRFLLLFSSFLTCYKCKNLINICCFYFDLLLILYYRNLLNFFRLPHFLRLLILFLLFSVCHFCQTFLQVFLANLSFFNLLEMSILFHPLLVTIRFRKSQKSSYFTWFFIDMKSDGIFFHIDLFCLLSFLFSLLCHSVSINNNLNKFSIDIGFYFDSLLTICYRSFIILLPLFILYY